MASAIEALGVTAKGVSLSLAQLSAEQKEKALRAMATRLQQQQGDILQINQQEVAKARSRECALAFLDRLTLTEARFNAMVLGLTEIAALPDPVGQVLAAWRVPSGLAIERVSTPLGVIAMIYEARPGVTAEAAALCFKAGNAVILRGGSECERTNRAIVFALQEGLREVGISPDAIQYVVDQARDALEPLLKMHAYIDVVIPRGGRALVEAVMRTSTIPVFGHLEGICHTYVHRAADLVMATSVVCNAKMRRPGICGATEILLVDEAIAKTHLPTMLTALQHSGCEIRGDAITRSIFPAALVATEQDGVIEYLDAILAVRVVSDVAEAIARINRYGSHHTDAIITEDLAVAQQFLQQVDSANVLHNCSTQFADGGEFGMGAEVGIATGKLHARGPIGAAQLTTFKYKVRGSGQVRAK